MNQPLHILHVVDNLGRGGLENGVANVITGLDPERFRHTVCAIRRLGANADRLAAHGVRVLCLETERVSAPAQIAAFMRVIRETRPDVLHSRNWPAVESVFAARLLRACAIVHSEHGLDWNSRLREPLRRACLRRMVFEFADKVLCVSHELKALHAQRTHFNAKRIAVIHNGVDTRRFAPRRDVRERLRAAHGISEGEFCIGCVGNLTPVKDYMTLLRALDRFAHVARDWRLLIAGEGTEQPRLAEFLSSRPWGHRVSFLGLSGDIPALLNAFDLYVLPSLSEGISNSLLEAMATRLPVVASNVGGNPEVVVDGESGSLFPAGDAATLAERLTRLYEQPDLRQRLAAWALQRVEEEFSVASMVQKYDRLYSEVGLIRAPDRHALVAPGGGEKFQTEELRSK